MTKSLLAATIVLLQNVNPESNLARAKEDMRNPLWILNLGMVLFFILTLGIIYAMRRPLPIRRSLVPTPVVLTPKKSISSIDLRRIYENDLFRTYQKPIQKTELESAINLTFPEPPVMKTPPRLQKPPAQFLDPLRINLKGIISVGDEKDNRVIIEDEKTKKEELYAVGDTIEDSEILRIDSTKVIFIRSNGQEETIYLNSQEAAADPIFSHGEPWNNVVQKVSNTSYAIDIELFKERIASPAEFIDLLDLTTAVKNQISVGCCIGLMAKNSIGHALGLMYGDVITSVNGKPVATTKDRVTLYNMLKKLNPGDTIRVKLVRQREIELLYVLKTSIDKQEYLNETTQDNGIGNEVANERPRSIVNLSTQPLSDSFAEMQKNDKMAMRQFGGRSALVERT